MASLTKTLAEATAQGDISRDTIGITMIEKALKYDSFLGSLPTKGVDGTVNGPYRIQDTSITVTRHNVGDTITESYVTNDEGVDKAGTFMSQIPMDVKVQTSHNTIDEWVDQLTANAWEFKEKLNDAFINGTADAGDARFNGLKALATGAGTDQLITTTAAGGTDLTFPMFMKLRNKVKYGVDFYLMHPNTAIDFYALSLSLGGNRWSDIQVPFAEIGLNGQLTMQNRSVKAFDGVPIYESEYMTTETLHGEPEKYRIIAGSYAQDRGITTFYPKETARRTSTMGFSMDPIQTKEVHDEDFIRSRWYIGMSLYSPLAIAQITNLKFTNA